MSGEKLKWGGGAHLLEGGGGGRDGYGFLRVGWQVGGSKVEKMHRVALMVEHHSFQMQAWRSAISAIRSCVSTRYTLQ